MNDMCSGAISLRTVRLLLRRPEPADAPRIQELAGAEEVAANTLSIPHPYEDGMAEEWTEQTARAWDEGTARRFAITTEAEGLVGVIGLEVAPEHGRAEMGFWVGVPYWGRGYATEAARAVVRHGFSDLGLRRIFAHHYRRNPASGRVLEKAGMRHEGTLRAHLVHHGRIEDLECWGVLGEEWERPPEGS